MPTPLSAAATLLSLRVAYGAALVAVPDRLTKRWLGAGRQAPAARVGLRALGAREVLLHTGALVALRRGDALRPWLVASALGDTVDVVATAASRDGLPENAALATLAVAGGSAVLSLAVAAALDA